MGDYFEIFGLSHILAPSQFYLFPESVAPNPKRHFRTANYRIAERSFDDPIGGGEQGLRDS